MNTPSRRRFLTYSGVAAAAAGAGWGCEASASRARTDPLPAGNVDPGDTSNIKDFFNHVENTLVSQNNRVASLESHALNVKSYGATGDGVTDDLAALIAARDAGVRLGVSVFVPKGTYSISGVLPLTQAAQRWECAAGAMFTLAAAATTKSMVAITGAGVTLVGGVFDGNKANQTADRDGIALAAAGVTVRDAEVKNCRGNGISLGSGSSDCLVTGNYSHDNGITTNAAAGIQVVNALRCRIIGNHCSNNGANTVFGGASDGDGIRLQGSTAAYNVVADNVCHNNARRGIKLQQGHAAITGNVCTGNGVAGIGVTNSLNPSHTTSTIAGNSLQDNYRGFQLDTCQNLLISGNVVTGSTDYGVLANNSANRVAFVGNVIANGQRHGLVIQGVEDWTITGNLFVDNGQALTSRYGVSVEDMTGRVNCKRILIAGNTSHNSGTNTTQTHGFVISGTGDKITLVGNATGNGTTVDYSIGASITDVATWSNTGATTNSATIPWTSYTMASGATIGSTPTGGFTIGANAAQKLSFYGKTPVVQAPAVTAAPTQSATYVQTDVQSIATALNAVITALRNIGITA